MYYLHCSLLMNACFFRQDFHILNSSWHVSSRKKKIQIFVVHIAFSNAKFWIFRIFFFNIFRSWILRVKFRHSPNNFFSCHFHPNTNHLITSICHFSCLTRRNLSRYNLIGCGPKTEIYGKGRSSRCCCCGMISEILKLEVGRSRIHLEKVFEASGLGDLNTQGWQTFPKYSCTKVRR